MSKRRPLEALALIAVVALVSACGSSAPAGTRSASSSGNNTPSRRDKAVKFAECMRDDGVKNFPDPADAQPLVDSRGPGDEAAVTCNRKAGTRASVAARISHSRREPVM
ncbi:MAG: hypothetical protein JO039_13380, partial [Solirubrobacterales bacterium]|nr:hypothetical protein [Solirubrobacterales bacterium]